MVKAKKEEKIEVKKAPVKEESNYVRFGEKAQPRYGDKDAKPRYGGM